MPSFKFARDTAAYLTAYRVPGERVKKRHILLPEEVSPSNVEELLELVFTYGQNYMQPQDGLRSVSVGDVLQIYDGKCWRVFLIESDSFFELPNFS